MTVTAYPLSWPHGFPRSTAREKGTFKTSLSGALDNVRGSLQRFAADSNKRIENVVISSNVSLGSGKPKDPGVAIWFVWDGESLCIPVDRYLTVEANLQAIHHIIEARRTELRHGSLALVRATFAGFRAALPSPDQAGGVDPHQTIGVSANDSPELKLKGYRIALSNAHPDKGGTPERFHQVREAGQALGLA